MQVDGRLDRVRIYVNDVRGKRLDRSGKATRALAIKPILSLSVTRYMLMVWLACECGRLAALSCPNA